MLMESKDMIILPLRDAPELLARAAAWFSSKWSVPVEAYQESMRRSIRHPAAVPQWYLILDGNRSITAGCGMIENDFHKRPDLTPNVCAVYVEPDYRGRGLARALLDYVRLDASRLGLDTLYLLTDHTAFYERCGWSFLCMAEDDEGGHGRMYAASALTKPTASLPTCAACMPDRGMIK